MPKFKRKPVMVEAERWAKGKEVEGVVCNPLNDPRTPDSYYVLTVNGWLPISEGDWIITEVAQKYICKPEKFDDFYELMEE